MKKEVVIEEVNHSDEDGEEGGSGSGSGSDGGSNSESDDEETEFLAIVILVPMAILNRAEASLERGK